MNRKDKEGVSSHALNNPEKVNLYQRIGKIGEIEESVEPKGVTSSVSPIRNRGERNFSKEMLTQLITFFSKSLKICDDVKNIYLNSVPIKRRTSLKLPDVFNLYPVNMNYN